MRESKRVIEREREKVREFPKPKALLDEAHPLLSQQQAKVKKTAQQDDVSSMMYLPSLTVRSSGIRSSSLLSMML